MDTFNGLLDTLLGWYFAAFGWSVGTGLVLISVLAGVGMLWVFARTSDAPKILAVKRRVYALLLELRVYGDEPGVMWRAQVSLVGANLRYMGLMLRPALWMAFPMALFLVHLDGYYGRMPLEVGQAAVFTVGLRATPGAAVLTAPRGVTVETEAVRVMAENQVSWRIRPVTPVSGALRFTIGDETAEKRIEAGTPPRQIAARRVRSAWDALWHPGEPMLGTTSIEWAELRYPEAAVSVCGVRLHWLVWFLLFSMAAALLLKKRFRVVL